MKVTSWSRRSRGWDAVLVVAAHLATGCLPPFPGSGELTGPCNDGKCHGEGTCSSGACIDSETAGEASDDTPGPSGGDGADGPGSVSDGPDGGTGSVSDGPDGGIDAGESGGQGDTLGSCDPAADACDGSSVDLATAFGINCPGGAQMNVTPQGSPLALGVRTTLGETGEWSPREGNYFVVLGSGRIADLDAPAPPMDDSASPTHCNDDLGDFDPETMLPSPLRNADVSGDCASDPSLVGTGDCSNTLASSLGLEAHVFDYTELRVAGVVPAQAAGFSYDFAFFSAEYPYYVDGQFSDMFVAWLESESWTGNVSFDDAHQPVSTAMEFFELRDDEGTLPEFAGTCMRGHGGTPWLTTTAAVVPGEEITVVFAVFDVSDSIVDSYVFLDHFRWSCEAGSHPTTVRG